MEDEINQVEYDMSFSTNARINVNLWKCNQYAEAKDPESWFEVCKTLFKEIRPKLKKDGEKTIHEEKMKDVETELKEYLSYVQIYNTNLAAKKAVVFEPKRNIFDSLFEWENMLRQELDNIGLLFKDKDDVHGL